MTRRLRTAFELRFEWRALQEKYNSGWLGLPAEEAAREFRNLRRRELQ